MQPRLCLYQYQHLPLHKLRDRWRRAEQLGFDVLGTSTRSAIRTCRGGAMFDGPSTLAAMALETTAIRIGTLVTSLYFRQPVTQRLHDRPGNPFPDAKGRER